MTKPNGQAPADAKPDTPGSFSAWHGSEKLAAAIPRNGVWNCDALKKDYGPLPAGWLHMKLGWWRGVAGKLEITGRRLDGPAEPLKARVPEGYGEKGLQVSGVGFPTEGLWEVTGKVADETVTFVVRVKKNADQ